MRLNNSFTVINLSVHDNAPYIRLLGLYSSRQIVKAYRNHSYLKFPHYIRMTLLKNRSSDDIWYTALILAVILAVQKTIMQSDQERKNLLNA
jgi:hypothetical protein